MMNFEDVEERDGMYPSQCYVTANIDCNMDDRCSIILECMAVVAYRGDEDSCPHLGAVHALENTRGSAACAL